MPICPCFDGEQENQTFIVHILQLCTEKNIEVAGKLLLVSNDLSLTTKFKRKTSLMNNNLAIFTP